MSPLIQNPNIGRKLQRNLRLTELPDGILAPEYVPVILVEDASAPLSDEERGCMGMQGVGGVAAEFGLVALVRVGAPAQYDLVVTEIVVATDVDQIIQVIIPTGVITGLTTSANTTFTDLELPGRPTSQMGFDTQAVIPAGRIIRQIPVLATTTYMFQVKIRIGTIGVGSNLTSIIIVGTTANVAVRGGYSWTESTPLG